MAYSKQRQHVPFGGVAANRRRRPYAVSPDDGVAAARRKNRHIRRHSSCRRHRCCFCSCRSHARSWGGAEAKSGRVISTARSS